MQKTILQKCTSCIFEAVRRFSTSNPHHSMKNFSKFVLIRMGTEAEKKKQAENPDPDLQYTNYGVRNPYYKLGCKTYHPPEMIPELIVPDLTNCDLKPYVSYRATLKEEAENEEFTSRLLFEAIYCKKIFDDFKNNKLDENGNPLEPSEEEKLTKKEALANAKKTGSDYFDEINPYTPIRTREGLD